MARYTNISILNLIRFWTGSQWRDLSIGVMCAVLLVNVTSLAAEFCRDCNLLICWTGRPERRELQKSRREEIKAWTNCSVASFVKHLRMKLRLKKTGMQLASHFRGIMKAPKAAKARALIHQSIRAYHPPNPDNNQRLQIGKNWSRWGKRHHQEKHRFDKRKGCRNQKIENRSTRK